MAITYDSIRKKLGFDPMTYKYDLKDYEDDSQESLLSHLSYEELDFLCEYLMKKDSENAL